MDEINDDIDYILKKGDLVIFTEEEIENEGNRDNAEKNNSLSTGAKVGIALGVISGTLIIGF